MTAGVGARRSVRVSREQSISSEESVSGASFREIRPDRSITEQVREAVRSAIIDGDLAPGALHSVQRLADAFGVSRTPVREALIDLARTGMVRFERNRGVRILQTSIHGLEEILALRLLLEVPAARRAAQLATPPVDRALERELMAMATAATAGDEPLTMRHDRLFHRAVNEASGNQRLADYVDSLRDLVVTSGVSTAGRSRSLEAIVAEHEAILAALRARDPAAAGAAMKAHLVSTALLLLEQEGGRAADAPLVWAELVEG